MPCWLGSHLSLTWMGYTFHFRVSNAHDTAVLLAFQYLLYFSRRPVWLCHLLVYTPGRTCHMQDAAWPFSGQEPCAVSPVPLWASSSSLPWGTWASGNADASPLPPNSSTRCLPPLRLSIPWTLSSGPPPHGGRSMLNEGLRLEHTSAAF